MGAAENKQFIRNMFVELSKGNAEVFLGGMAEDVHFTIIGTTKYSGTVSSSIAKNGSPYNNTYCYIFRIADGKVRDVTDYLDTELITSVFGK
jgi:ketosteroid isomerase-like protein